MKRLAAVLCILSLAACHDEQRGLLLAKGAARRLTLSTSAVAFLTGAVHPDDRGVPDDLLQGDLWLGSLDGKGPAQKVSGGVPSIDGGFSFSPAGDKLAWLASYRFRAGQGELWMGAPGAAPGKVADEVSTFRWAPQGGALAFVSAGRLGLLDGAGARRGVALDGVESFTFAPDGRSLAARAPGAQGGRVWLVDVASGARRELSQTSSDYAFAIDGSLGILGLPPPKGGDRPLSIAAPGGDAKLVARATSFAFAPSGKELVLASTERHPGEGFGELSRLPVSGGEAQPLGERVSEWRFTPTGALVYLARFDLRARAGTLTVALPGQKPREIASKVQSYVVEGTRALYLVQSVLKGDYKIELWDADLAAGTPPRKIDEGVYGYQLSPDGADLYWKSRCSSGQRSCSLSRAPADGSSAPVFLSANVAGFDLSQDGSRILIEQPHRGATRAVDLAVIGAHGAPPAAVKPFALEVDASSRFADAQGKRVVYAVLTQGSAGVYLADVP